MVALTICGPELFLVFFHSFFATKRCLWKWAILILASRHLFGYFYSLSLHCWIKASVILMGTIPGLFSSFFVVLIKCALCTHNYQIEISEKLVNF